MSKIKYVTLSKLSTFLDNLKNKFSAVDHKHEISDVTNLKTTLDDLSNTKSSVQFVFWEADD